MRTQHECGGTILAAGGGVPGGEISHLYCDHCRAFTFDVDGDDFPSGTDRAANGRAWDEGKRESPSSRVAAHLVRAAEAGELLAFDLPVDLPQDARDAIELVREALDMWITSERARLAERGLL